MDLENQTGQCLCSSVSFKAAKVSSNLGVCHCNSCRRWGGGPLFALDCGSEVAFDNSEHIGTYRSSDWAQRGFCKQCGSHLFYQLIHNKQYIMPAGLFDLDDKINFDHQVFIDEKPNYYCFTNKTKDMTGAEMFAQFNS